MGSEIETAAICLGAALANEDTPEGDTGRALLAYACLDIHAAAVKGAE